MAVDGAMEPSEIKVKKHSRSVESGELTGDHMSVIKQTGDISPIPHRSSDVLECALFCQYCRLHVRSVPFRQHPTLIHMLHE
jgi:hypothetical protein